MNTQSAAAYSNLGLAYRFSICKSCYKPPRGAILYAGQRPMRNSNVCTHCYTSDFDEHEFKFSDTDKTFVGAGEWLSKVKESAATAFKPETKAPYVVRPTNSASNTEITKENFNKLGYAARLALKRENPKQYNTLKE